VRSLLSPRKVAMGRVLLAVLVAATASMTAGCSAIPHGRPAVPPKMHTSLSVGETPLPVATGSGDASVSSAVVPEDEVGPPLSRKVRPDSRISGRVFDQDGKPVPDARVRLAVGSSAGGKVVSQVTDRSGAFTLKGLRPGSSYTVIAEQEDEAGVLSGRAVAQTSDTDVRIRLASADDPEPAPRSTSAARVKPVSDRDDAEADGETPEPAPAPRPRSKAASRRTAEPSVNEEDLPPATEAEAMATPAEPTTRAATSTRKAHAADATRHWQAAKGDNPPAGNADESVPTDPAEPPPSARPRPHPTSGSRSSATRPPRPATDRVIPVGDDDGDNPLPPAREGPDPRSPSAGPDDPPGPTAMDQNSDQQTTRPPAASSSFASLPNPTEPPDGVVARTPPRQAGVIVPETYGPVVVAADPDTRSAPVTGPAVGRLTRTGAARNPAPDRLASRARSNPFADGPPGRGDADPSDPSDPPATAGSAARARGGRRRLTWGDVAASTTLPPLEGAAADPSGPGHTAGLGGPAPGSSLVSCEYDERHRQIKDFQLPDLDGRPVRFQDFESDLVLLDFWGTWCDPCLKSIPHLVDLQSRLGGERLTVVGVACEKDAADVAAPRVAEAADRLKVNYPVLLSRTDGSCPLQEKLHVQALPTLVLLDRRGHVLWSAQGATTSTLARLDRQIASAPAAAGPDRLIR